MSEQAIVNGQLIAARELSVPATDAGFLWGITVAEQIRTFAGQLFRLDEHIQRLFHSLSIVGFDIEFTPEQIAEQALRLTRTNHSRLAEGDDLCLVIFVTPGSSPAMATSGPIVGLHTYPIAFADWAHKYTDGQRLVTSSIRQVTADNWPPSLKCRSRMHYYLADQEARQADPLARALLLDADGFVCEASTANVLAVIDNKLTSPGLEKILPGISLAVIDELANDLNIDFTYRDIKPDELARATEIMLCSTSCCVLPVTRVDHIELPTGPVFERLLHQWSANVGIDIRHQAQTIASLR